MMDRLLFPGTFADILAHLWMNKAYNSIIQRNPATVMKVNLPVPHQLHTDIPRLGLILVCVFVLLQDQPIWFGPRYLHWHRTHEQKTLRCRLV